MAPRKYKGREALRDYKVAYGGRGRSCSHCLLSDYAQEEYALRPPRMVVVSGRAGSKADNRRDIGKAEERRRKRGACFAWNDGSCRLPYRRFEHVFSRCFGEHRRDACQSRPDEREEQLASS